MADAEEILSRQLTRRAGSDHSTFAHRALIRVRLYQWDVALRDAETVSIVFFLHALKVILLHGQSIEIQPSVTAHVAKGLALFGQDEHALATQAFHVALRECDVSDKVIVSFVKVSYVSTYVGSLTTWLLSTVHFFVHSRVSY